MRKDLTIDDLGDLTELRLLAVLATHRRDGTTLLSPVWHAWRDGGAEAGAAYAERAADDLLIRLEPGVLRAWDFADGFS